MPKKARTNKSFAKRVRITKTGKLIRRPMGVNHFKTRKNANGVRSKRAVISFALSPKRINSLTN